MPQSPGIKEPAPNVSARTESARSGRDCRDSRIVSWAPPGLRLIRTQLTALQVKRTLRGAKHQTQLVAADVIHPGVTRQFGTLQLQATPIRIELTGLGD